MPAKSHFDPNTEENAPVQQGIKHSPTAGTNSRVISKREIKMPDGRYMIFYTDAALTSADQINEQSKEETS